VQISRAEFEWRRRRSDDQARYARRRRLRLALLQIEVDEPRLTRALQIAGEIGDDPRSAIIAAAERIGTRELARWIDEQLTKKTDPVSL
jgi:hypothetical protein